MVVLCHAMDDMEVLFLRALLQSEDIHFAIVGEHFGSLYPGVQIASYNERRFLVPFEEYERAAALIAEHRAVYDPVISDLSVGARVRIFIEGLVFGWCVPGGRKSRANKDCDS